jgi:DNA-directed RNA polymerase specialized sigma24 family protein
VEPGAPANPQAPRDFRTTHWSLVLEAGAETENGRSALETLCRHYWYPLYVFVRRRGNEPAEAEDLTQEFFAQLLAGSTLSTARPERGRFRTFLLVALKRFLANQWDHANRLKRGGGREFIALDALEPEARYQVEPATNAPEDVMFDRQWARTLTNGVMARMRLEAEREGSAARFDALKAFLAAEPAGGSYSTLAADLGLSVSAVKSAIHRLRRRYGQMLREEISHTLGVESDIEDEIRHLFAALAS